MKVGETFHIQIGKFSGRIKCVAVEVDETGRLLKGKAIEPDERLGKIGFLIEGDDYVIKNWCWSKN